MKPWSPGWPSRRPPLLRTPASEDVDGTGLPAFASDENRRFFSRRTDEDVEADDGVGDGMRLWIPFCGREWVLCDSRRGFGEVVTGAGGGGEGVDRVENATFAEVRKGSGVGGVVGWADGESRESKMGGRPS